MENDDQRYPERQMRRPGPVYLEGTEDEWEIEAIVDERCLGRGWQYRVTYAGWGEEDAQWRSRSELRETAPELVARWEEVHPK